MTNKLLSVEEGNKKFVSAEKAGLSIEGLKNLLLQQMGAYRPLSLLEESLEYKKICARRFEELLYAVRREERERGAAIAETEGYFDLAKKILEEK